MRVFISVPTEGRTDAEIAGELNEAIKIVKADNPHEDIRVIGNFFREEPCNDNPLWCLGKSIELLSSADLAFFGKGWKDARECRIEFACAIAYEIEFLIQYD